MSTRYRFIVTLQHGYQVTTVIAALLLVTIAGTQTATAGSYTVNQCDYEIATTTNSFMWQASGVPAPLQHANSGCSEFGLAARTSGVGTAQVYPAGARGGYMANAPSGTVFSRFSGTFGTLANCCVPGMDAYAEARKFADGSGAHDEIFRGSLGATTWQAPSGSQGPVRVEWSHEESGFGAEQIGYFLACANPSGCVQSTTGDLRVRGRSFEFTLDDLIGPEVVDIGGDLVSDGWLRGTRSLAITAADQGGGLASLSATLDGQPVLNASSSCSEIADRYVDLRPCPLNRAGVWDIDTREVNDGFVSLLVRADDAGRASAETSRIVRIDNSAPAAPVAPSLEGEQKWRSNNGFTIGWDLVDETYAPISRTHYEICSVPHGICHFGSRSGDGDGAIQVEVPAPGVYELRLWLEDAAGNVDSESPSADVLLRFDDEVPGRADVGAPDRWLNAAQAEAAVVSLGLEPGTTEPVSGVAGFSTTNDGSQPDGSVDIAGSAPIYGVDGLPEGETSIRARTISGSGKPAVNAGAGSIKIDRSSPSVAVEGLPARASWQRSGVQFRVVSADQPGLSGVSSAPPDRPISEGGYLELRVDGVAQDVPGDRASVVVNEDGAHTLTYRAFDVAGNASVQKEAVFRIDGTGPVGAFRALDPGDPRELRVDVGDATSGVRDGRIEFRREGAGGFVPLVMRRDGGLLTARLEDQGVAPGRYEVRAVVTDVAGNESVIDRWADGSATTLGLPLRLAASVTVQGDPGAKVCPKATSKRRGEGRGRKPAARPKCKRKAGPSKLLRLRHGRRAASSGSVITAQGAPIAGSAVVVEGQARSGGPFARLGTAKTDAQGRFRFKIPAGPSRTVRYRYEGTNSVRPAEAQLTTRVSAAARLRVDRRRLRNGQAVRFTGRLLGKPIPASGKLVALQAKVARGWRTFATPRANARGVFRHRYRFTATTGLRRYAFRAVVAREAAYPYEAGRSATVKVTVRGR